MSGKLTDKIALITGGSSGIGLATAKRFVDEGAYVFITGRRVAELEKARAEIGHSISIIQGDVASLDDLDRVFETIKQEKGSLDVLVINAGFVEHATLATATPEHFDKTFNINARGAFFTAQKSLPLLNSGASIVLVASAAHLMGVPIYTTYGATKSAMRSFARSWATELKDRGIRVNNVSPGPVETPIIDGQFKTKEDADAVRASFKQRVPMGRMGEASELAAAILFLASAESSFSTGIDLVVDGGLTQL